MQGCTYVLGNRYVPPTEGGGNIGKMGKNMKGVKNKRMKEWKKKEKLR
jgi:hypothetical protein